MTYRLMRAGIEGCVSDAELLIRERTGEEDMNARTFVKRVKAPKEEVKRFVSVYRTPIAQNASQRKSEVEQPRG